jgi:hypothetical protein
MARVCPHCGRSNDDDARFCQGCGASIAAAATPPGAAVTREAPAVGGSGRSAPKWLAALIILAVIAVAAFLALLYLPRGESTGEGEGSQTGASVAISPMPALEQYLACAVGPRADRLATIAADGTVKPIARFNGDKIWQIAYSPDGKWLACIAGSFKRRELWLFDAATGTARQTTAKTPHIVAVDSIAWLSARELLVAGYTETPRSTGQNAGFFVYRPAAESFAPLLGDGAPLRGVSVSASSDGTRVAFVTYTDHKTDAFGMATARERLQVLDRNSGDVTELGANKALFDVDARAFDEPLISPSGEAIIYRRAGSDVGTSYTVVGTGGTVLMPAKETQVPAGYAWDPGGTKVVFTGHSLRPADTESGLGPAIFWVFDTKAGGAAQVVARYEDTFVQNLSWSPDGATIAWAAYDEKKEWRTGNVYLMRAGGGGDSTALVKEALSPVWAPGPAEGLQTAPSPQ